MNKNQGATIGAILLAGLLMRPIGGNSPAPSGDQKAPSASSQVVAQPSGPADGPWVASCNYWSPVRTPEDEAADKPASGESQDSQPSKSKASKGKAATATKILEPGTEFRVQHLQTMPSTYNVHMENAEPHEAPCPLRPGLRWGLPADIAKAQIRTRIAVVPDPAHSHATLDFDRTIDSIIQAAEDNHYTSTYFWLPWKNHGRATGDTASSGDKEPGHDPERERQPGLIVFKHVPVDQEDNSPDSAYYKVIYLFLVGETATEGVNGDQIKNALTYQEELASRFPAAFSDCPVGDAKLTDDRVGCIERGRKGKISIIGPAYTGSAASLRAAIDAHFKSAVNVEAAGTTSSLIAEKQLAESGPSKVAIEYESFSDYLDYDSQRFRQLLIDSQGHYYPRRVFQLAEDNTARGQSASVARSMGSPGPQNFRPDLGDFTVIRYPRGISLLRNAQPGSDSSNGGGSSGVPSPYLPLSLKDTTSEDSVPHYSREDTPLSQEAELMMIARELIKSRAQFVFISASNIMDELFLMQFLHRACPDVRLLFMGGDLLLVREIDNVPYIGSVTLGAYPLIGIGRSQRAGPQRAYPDPGAVAYYNAASYTFWDGSATSPPVLTGYSNPLENPNLPGHMKPPLWETVIGSNGYYPLALLDECGSKPQESPGGEHFLPVIGPDGISSEPPCNPTGTKHEMRDPKLPVFPSLMWNTLCVVISLLCAFHFSVMLAASYWSPFTRDLAIADNVEPGRRSMYVRIGTAMLFSMAFVVAFPLFPLRWYLLLENRSDLACALVVLVTGFAAAGATVWKTWNHLKWWKTPAEEKDRKAAEGRRKNNLCFTISLLAGIAALGIPTTWIYLCLRGQNLLLPTDNPTYAGLMFAYRCMHPESGVSPIVPIVLLLLAWYLWAFCQTWRLRFSMTSRPVMPAGFSVPSVLFVADGDLDHGGAGSADCGHPLNSCLYSNLTCILITREILRRFWRTASRAPDITLTCIYVGLLLLFLCVPPLHSLESLVRLWNLPDVPMFFERSGIVEGLVRLEHLPDVPMLFERLIIVLFFPLLAISLAGWLRMILIWGSLRRSLLERLENYPIRFAFSQLRDTGWMAMVRQGGLQEWWRDMARSSESMHQMLKDKELKEFIERNGLAGRNRLDGIDQPAEDSTAAPAHPEDYEDPCWSAMRAAASEFDRGAGVLRSHARGEATVGASNNDNIKDHQIMHEIEKNFGAFAQGLLRGALIPHWKERSQRFVESEDAETLPIKARRSDTHTQGPHEPLELHASKEQTDPIYIRVAEEFLAIRYVSLIRSVLVNMRRLMSFVSAAFVLAIIAWNSYPFEPRQLIDWIFTAMLFILGLGIVWVLAQMYRDPILSRITDTKANELGFEFWIRLVSLGAVPVLTWLAYTFPDIGSFLFKFFQPAVSVTH